MRRHSLIALFADLSIPSLPLANAHPASASDLFTANNSGICNYGNFHSLKRSLQWPGWARRASASRDFVS